MSRSEELIQELESSDLVVIGTPMHNFTVPSALKAWIDHVVRVRRTFNVTPEGKVGTLRDRPVFVAVSSGGRFSGERARQPDFLTPYLKAILGTIGLHDLTFFSVQGTASGPDAVAEARRKTDQALEEYFLSFCPRPVSAVLSPPLICCAATIKADAGHPCCCCTLTGTTVGATVRTRQMQHLRERHRRRVRPVLRQDPWGSVSPCRATDHYARSGK